VKRLSRPSPRTLAEGGLCVLSGLLTALAMPGFGLAWAGALCLVPLLVATHGKGPKRAFLLGWLAGTTAFLVGMSWVADTVHLYGGLPYVAAWPVAILPALYQGLYTGAFAWGLNRMTARRVPPLLGGPLLWVALEFARSHVFGGMPWNLLGHALAPMIRFIQVADLGGIYAVSWFAATVNLSLFALLTPLLDRGQGRLYRQGYWLFHAVVLCLVPICVATYGQVRIASLSIERHEHPDPAGPIRVGLVQPNIPQDVKWDPAYREATLARLERLTRKATADADSPPEVVIWPEASAPLLLDLSPGFRRRVALLARDLGVHLMVGSLAEAPDKRGAVLNAVYMIDPDGRVTGRTAKAHLVPFGEYVPLERLLFFVRSITSGIGDVVPGAPPFRLPLPRGDAAVAVCFELTFPNLVRERMNDETGGTRPAFLATVTNDAWFGRSAAPAQHFAHAVFRAVENRAYVVRSANTGISGMVDPYGVPHLRTELDREAAVTVDIGPRFARPFYARHGNVLAWASVILSAVFLTFRFPRRPGPGAVRG
jgi:apolipoprotein N-acyltransferase